MSYCDNYCLGAITEVMCDEVIDKVKCIMSCLDCHSADHTACFCPSIFPPVPKGTSRQSVLEDYGEENDTAVHPELRNKSNKTITAFVATISIGVPILICLIAGVAYFCYYNKNQERARNAAAQGKRLRQTRILRGTSSNASTIMSKAEKSEVSDQDDLTDSSWDNESSAE